MMTLLLLAAAWVLTAGFAMVLFTAAKNADRRAELMLQEARVADRRPHRGDIAA